MRRRVVAIGLSAVALLIARPAAAQTVDELLAKNIQAKGGMEKLRSVQTVKQTGRVNFQGTEAKQTVYAKRPNLIRQELNMAGQLVVMAYDGNTPWMINPNLGAVAPIALTGPLAAIVERTIAPQYVGEPVADPEGLFYKALWSNNPVHAAGIGMRAMSVVDCAAWDLLCQTASWALSKLSLQRGSKGGRVNSLAASQGAGPVVADVAAARFSSLCPGGCLQLPACHQAGQMAGSSRGRPLTTARTGAMWRCDP